MTPSHLIGLMHTVLDGEATPAQARELELQLAADPSARAEFGELKALFQLLGQLPAEHAPEGLVAAVTAGLLPAANARRGTDQLFKRPRVFGHALSKPPGQGFGNAAANRPVHASAPHTRSAHMSQQSRIFANRKAWIGGGIAAAVLVVMAQYSFDAPKAENTLGTIVPAQRFRAPQNGSEAVNLGAPSVAVGGQSPQAAGTTAAVGADRAGADRAGADRAGADRAGADRAGADRAGADRAGADRAGADRAGADRAGADRAGADRAGADRAGADRAGADRAGADRAGADRAGADRAGADRAGADRAGADRAGADRAGADRAGADRAGADRAGADRAGADRAGADRAGADRSSTDR